MKAEGLISIMHKEFLEIGKEYMAKMKMVKDINRKHAIAHLNYQ